MQRLTAEIIKELRFAQRTLRRLACGGCASLAYLALFVATAVLLYWTWQGLF